MTEQARPPTDAEQNATLITANAQLRVRVGELEKIITVLREIVAMNEIAKRGMGSEITTLEAARDELARQLAVREGGG